MLSPIERELLGDLVKEIHRLNLHANKYTCFLGRLTDRFSGNSHDQKNPGRFTDSEVERLMKLNRHLGGIESLIHNAVHELKPGLIDKIKNPDDLSSVRLIFKQIHLVTEVRCDDSVVIKLQGA